MFESGAIMSLAKGFCVLKNESTEGWCHNRWLQFDKKGKRVWVRREPCVYG
jgi:hypothetical protein